MCCRFNVQHNLLDIPRELGFIHPKKDNESGIQIRKITREPIEDRDSMESNKEISRENDKDLLINIIYLISTESLELFIQIKVSKKNQAFKDSERKDRRS